ncbi:MAG: hypothetical protein CME70_24200 [Halobacteriovorax sp.]|nr:hypothetical protein [Halobacteriovorax sp.]|tara:strand:+ start:21326 stop:21646 length:321 start_codon:yes stop_codon:yes gene_type:complete
MKNLLLLTAILFSTTSIASDDYLYVQQALLCSTSQGKLNVKLAELQRFGHTDITTLGKSKVVTSPVRLAQKSYKSEGYWVPSELKITPVPTGTDKICIFADWRKSK